MLIGVTGSKKTTSGRETIRIAQPGLPRSPDLKKVSKNINKKINYFTKMAELDLLYKNINFKNEKLKY